MINFDEWKALSGRIRGLVEAGRLYAQFQTIHRTDTYAVGQNLHQQSGELVTELQTFKERYHQSLSRQALTRIDRLIVESKQLTSTSNINKSLKEERVWGMLVILAAFEADMSHLLMDAQQQIRTRSELAFSHLQRLIAADSEYRTKWQRAYAEREETCEALGAVHLLSHGIWAFKVNAEGARTDLVFQEPSGNLVNEQRFVEGLILTEWKKAAGKQEAAKQFEAGRTQAKKYCSGALAGCELSDYRYVIVVSDCDVDTPENVEEGGIIYRHINISINPRTPSRR